MRDNFISIYPSHNKISQRDTCISAFPHSKLPAQSSAGIVLYATRDSVMPKLLSEDCVISDKQIL